jgi:small subunit ribosomal protein S8
MTVTDPIADLLTRVRNATRANHDHVLVPVSKLKLDLIKVLKAEGYVQKYDLVDDQKHGAIRITLKYGAKRRPVITGIRRVSRPGRRHYVNTQEIPRIMGGLGTAVLSTPEGLMTDKEARRRHLGGEVLCEVW